MSKRLFILSILTTVSVCGCTLTPPPDLGDRCANAEYYADGAGITKGSFTTPNDPYYALYKDFAFCPGEYPVCATDSENRVFCHQTCPNTQVYCNGCIDPMVSNPYCGARGMCNNPHTESPDYHGVECASAEVCRKGVCSCPDKSQILCGESCINPLRADDYCGASGLCSSDDPDSQDYAGVICPRVQRCIEGTCQCAENNFVLCDDHCIDPGDNRKYCGAKGFCTSDEPNSPDWRGKKCRSGYICSENDCHVDCQIGLHEDSDHCVADDNENCGKVGFACSPGELCSEGQCAANCSNTEFKCTYNDKEICVNPENNPLFCGANPDCSVYTRCSDRQNCQDSNCVCKRDYHIYENAETPENYCEPNTDENCGAHGMVCEATQIDFSTEAHCSVEGECEATACATGYHLYEAICELNDMTNCGGHDVVCQTTSVSNSSSVECSTNGKCEATACRNGYHVYEGKCEKNSNDHCGEHNNPCSKSDVEGSEIVSCDTGVCLPVTCDSNHVLNGSACMESECTDGTTKCVLVGTTGKIYECSNKTWREKRTCTNNNSCNSDKTDCGECINTSTSCSNDAGIGKIKTCTNGTWSTSTTSCETVSCNREMTGCGICKNDETKCTDSGSVGQLSTCKLGEWDTGNCINNHSCKSNTACGDCKNGAKQCNGTAVQTCTSGAWGSNVTCSPPNNGQAVCNAGSCGITCNSGYCASGSSCVSIQTSMTNCGSCNTICKASNFAHATIAICAAGTCMPTACEDGFELIDGTCVGNAPHPTECSSGVNYIYRTVTDGTEKRFYCLKNRDDLIQLATNINNGNVYPENNTDNAYALATDITINKSDWPGIGTNEHPFTGVFYGNNRRITLTGVNTGVFGYIKNSTVEDLSVVYTSTSETGMNCQTPYCGGLANEASYTVFNHVTVSFYFKNEQNAEAIGIFIGKDTKSSIINSIITNSKIESPAVYAGGFVGNGSNTTIKNSKIESIDFGETDTMYTGAVIGYGTKVNIENVTVYEPCNILKSYHYAGGLAGYLISSKVKECVVSCNINSGSEEAIVGGLVADSSNNTYTSSAVKTCSLHIEGTNHGGFVGQSKNDIFTSCVVDHKVFIYSIGKNTGGFTGHSTDGQYTQCVSFAYLQNTIREAAGGFVGYSNNDTMNFCVTAGIVGGVGKAGGFVGIANGDEENKTTINYSYAYRVISAGAPRGAFAGHASNLQIEMCYYKLSDEYSAIGNGNTYEQLLSWEEPDVHIPDIGEPLMCEVGMTEDEGEFVQINMSIPESTSSLLEECK